LIAAIWVAKTSYCSYRTLVTFYWKAKNYYLFYPLIVLFIALMSSLTFFLFWLLIMSYISIYYWILSAYFIGVILLGGGMVFFIEFARFFYLLTPLVYFAISLSSFTSFTGFIYFISYFGIYFTIYFGGYLGWRTYYFLFIWLELLGGILFWEFLGYRTCFMFWGGGFWGFWGLFFVFDPFCYLLVYYFLIAFALYIFWMFSLPPYFLTSILFLL
jgi:hypothetical protein